MAERRVTKVDHGVAGPVNELPWLRRKLAVRVTRRMLRKMPVEGLLDIDRDGHPIWAPGYPKASDQR